MKSVERGIGQETAGQTVATGAMLYASTPWAGGRWCLLLAAINNLLRFGLCIPNRERESYMHFVHGLYHAIVRFGSLTGYAHPFTNPT